MIVAALINAGLLGRVDWTAPHLSSRRLAAAGAASLLLWLSAIALGRWIAYA